MQYMLLIYSADDAGVQPGTPEISKMMQGQMEFNSEARMARDFVAGAPQQGASTASTLRLRNGRTKTTVGPFAETMETLGGYYSLNCIDQDEAHGWDAIIPTSEYGSIEVQPVVELSS